MIRKTGRLYIALIAVAPGFASAPTLAATPCNDPVLAAAAELRDNHQFDRAQAVVTPLFAKASTAKCAADAAIAIETARKAAADGPLDKAVDGFKASAFAVLSAFAIAAGAGLAIGILVGVLRLASLVRRTNCKPRWRVREIGAGSDPMLLAAWRRAMGRSATRLDTNANLLIQSGLRLPRTSVRDGIIDMDIQHLLQGAPSFQGVSLVWLQSVFQYLARISHSPRRTLKITATTHEKSAIVHLEAWDAAANYRNDDASGTWTGDTDIAEEIDAMATRLALKTNYLIADGATDVGVVEQQQMQAGIEKLNAYSRAHDPMALKEAVAAFHGAAQLKASVGSATLYEGIANELLEDHDRAARLFGSIAPDGPISDQTGMLALQAAYNAAITDLRRYKPGPAVASSSALKKLADGITGLTSNAQSPEKRRLHAFALAARANAIAHYFIFWDSIDTIIAAGTTVFTQAELDQKKTELNGWNTSAESLLDKARRELSSDAFTNDASATVQLRWLIDNATGNLALNRANCGGPAGIDDELARRRLLSDALAAFQRCEALVTPGVETMTNIATTLIALDQPTGALDYTRRARALNPAYEYAYMREYEAQTLRGDRFGERAILIEASDTLGVIKIPEFMRHFEEVGVAYHAR